MAVSTNSIFHFTKYKSSINSILKDAGFRVSFCLEKFSLDQGYLEAGIPMVSFCDIPLSQIQPHIKNYGSYAIALSKNWAYRNGLNPVSYVNRSSFFSSLIEPMIIRTFYHDEYGDIGYRYQMSEIKDDLVEIRNIYSGERKLRIDSLIGQLSFMKNHHGDLMRNEKLLKKNYRFYDEREWRHVPIFEDFAQNSLTYYPFMNKSEYKNWRGKSKKKDFIPKMKLSFSSDDIDYIILKNEKEVSTTIKQIEKCDKLFRTKDEFHLLISKIFTSNKIIEDI